MAVRTDIYSIDWNQSPRIINIDISITEANAQDLYDTCKFLEQLPSGMDEDQICDAGGWEPLGGGKFVGITVSLFNARYKFADRTGPEWVICNMAGGNVVGFEDQTKQATLYPREPSSFVSADRTASSAATTSEQEAIQFGSFLGGVTVDLFNTTGRATSGILFPAGTELQPVNNLADLHTLLSEKGLNRIYIKGDLVLDDDGSWVGHEFIGESKIRTLVTVDPDTDVFNCEFRQATLTGELDGSSHVEECLLIDLDFIDGFIENCSLGSGTITLGTSTTANIFESKSTVAGQNTPIIDMGGTGLLNLSGHNGGVLLENYSGSGDHSINLARGQVKLRNTIVSGSFQFRGIGKLIDESGNRIESGTWNGGVNIVNELIDSDDINFIRAVLEGDVVPTPAQFRILDRITKNPLIVKDATLVSGLTQLTET